MFRKIVFCALSSILLFSSSQVAFAGNLSSEREAFLDKVQKATFQFFKNEVNLRNGLVRDIAFNRDSRPSNSPASIAGVGFALTVYPVAVERGWMSRDDAHDLTVRTLEFFLNNAEQHRGFFYHFLDFNTGERAGKSELSPIDTALFLAGAIFAAEYFDDLKITTLVKTLYERVDFPWMLNGGDFFALAWNPETGFNKLRWDHFDESLILYILAIGSPGNPISENSWKKLARPVGSYREYRLIQMPPLFTHQFPHVWIDFRDKNDGIVDYFQNSINASKANYMFCREQYSKFSGYKPPLWGISASDGPGGYRAYGAPPGWNVSHDGTVTPTACGSSIVFTPEEAIACLEAMYETYGKDMWGRYGFSDAMNLGRNWTSDKVFAINEGPIFLMIENYRTEMIWNLMKKSASIQTAMEKIGFKNGTIPVKWVESPVYKASYMPQGLRIDGYLKDWTNGNKIKLTTEENKEFGYFDEKNHFEAEVRFAWNEEYLFFIAKVEDNDILAKRTGKNIFRDDLLELYVDPDGDGLYWDDSNDYQIGFRPGKGDLPLAAWSWFQGGENPFTNQKVLATSYVDEKGYLIEGAIRWSAIGVTPEAGKVVRITPAVHEVDSKGDEGKLVWFFRNEEKFRKFMLGKVVLDK